MRRTMRRGVLAGIVTSALVVPMLAAAPAVASGGRDHDKPGHGHSNGHHGNSNKDRVKKLTKAVTVPGVMRHLLAFQAIANRNDDTRASGTTWLRQIR